MRKDGGADYALVRGLTRGLDLLKALNSQEGGRSTLAQLAEVTGLHRTTVRRLLETLIAEGYVRRSESDDRYCLALNVRSLAEGFRDEDWVSSIAAPALSELLQTVVWPSDLTTPQGAALIIRESTHRFSPLSFHRAMVGQTIPMLLTAAGRAYFAHCPEEQQEQILHVLRAGDGAEASLGGPRALRRRHRVAHPGARLRQQRRRMDIPAQGGRDRGADPAGRAGGGCGEHRLSQQAADPQGSRTPLPAGPAAGGEAGRGSAVG